MKATNYVVPSPTAEQIARYEQTGCSAAEKRATVKPATISPKKLSARQVKEEAHRLALKFGLGIE